MVSDRLWTALSRWLRFGGTHFLLDDVKSTVGVPVLFFTADGILASPPWGGVLNKFLQYTGAAQHKLRQDAFSSRTTWHQRDREWW